MSIPTQNILVLFFFCYMFDSNYKTKSHWKLLPEL